MWDRFLGFLNKDIKQKREVWELLQVLVFEHEGFVLRGSWCFLAKKLDLGPIEESVWGHQIFGGEHLLIVGGRYERGSSGGYDADAVGGEPS